MRICHNYPFPCAVKQITFYGAQLASYLQPFYARALLKNVKKSVHLMFKKKKKVLFASCSNVNTNFDEFFSVAFLSQRFNKNTFILEHEIIFEMLHK